MTAQEVHELSLPKRKARFRFCHPRVYMLNVILKCRRSIFRSNLHTVSIICVREWHNIITKAWKIINVYWKN